MSTVPTSFGESVVMRILDRESVVFDFASLGFTDSFQQRFVDVLNKPHGILLVTGPTGSGKTTTLYTALSRINTNDVKIITVEDPVEYQLEGINQMQVKPQIGLDFSGALRAITSSSGMPSPRNLVIVVGMSTARYCTLIECRSVEIVSGQKPASAAPFATRYTKLPLPCPTSNRTPLARASRAAGSSVPASGTSRRSSPSIAALLRAPAATLTVPPGAPRGA